MAIQSRNGKSANQETPRGGRLDDAKAAQVIDEYRGIWHAQRDALAPEATKTETITGFQDSYPLHPDVLETFTSKTATLANFQRVRGMLRILGRTVGRLWELKPADATAIHLHHIDPGYEPVRQEIVTRLGQSMYVSAIRSDIAGEQGNRDLMATLPRIWELVTSCPSRRWRSRVHRLAVRISN